VRVRSWGESVPGRLAVDLDRRCAGELQCTELAWKDHHAASDAILIPGKGVVGTRWASRQSNSS
jgi:hypothetical protein